MKSLVWINKAYNKYLHKEFTMLMKPYHLFTALLTCLVGFSSALQAEPSQVVQAPATQKIQAIVFDFGGVIAKGDKTEIGQFIAKEFGISQADAMQVQSNLKLYLVSGGTEENFWKEYAATSGHQLPNDWLEQLDNTRLKAIKEIPGMVQVVKELQQQGYQTPLLSNVRMSQARLKRQLGYYDMFYPVLLSYEIGADKPGVKAYEILLERLKMKPGTLLFVDNKADNVAAAKTMGIDGVVFENAQQLVGELQKRGIHIKEVPVEATKASKSEANSDIDF